LKGPCEEQIIHRLYLKDSILPYDLRAVLWNREADARGHRRIPSRSGGIILGRIGCFCLGNLAQMLGKNPQEVLVTQ